MNTRKKVGNFVGTALNATTAAVAAAARTSPMDVKSDKNLAMGMYDDMSDVYPTYNDNSNHNGIAGGSGNRNSSAIAASAATVNTGPYPVAMSHSTRSKIAHVVGPSEDAIRHEAAGFTKRARSDNEFKRNDPTEFMMAEGGIIAVQTDADVGGGSGGSAFFPATAGLRDSNSVPATFGHSFMPGGMTSHSTNDHSFGGTIDMAGFGSTTTGAPEGASDVMTNNIPTTISLHVLEPDEVLSSKYDVSNARSIQQIPGNLHWVLNARDVGTEHIPGTRLYTAPALNVMFKNDPYLRMNLTEIMQVIEFMGNLKVLERPPGAKAVVSNMAGIHIAGPTRMPNYWVGQARGGARCYWLLKRVKLSNGASAKECWQLVPWASQNPMESAMSAAFSCGRDGHAYFVGTFSHQDDPEIGIFNEKSMTAEKMREFLSPNLSRLGSDAEIAKSFIAQLNGMPQATIYLEMGRTRVWFNAVPEAREYKEMSLYGNMSIRQKMAQFNARMNFDTMN